MTVETISDKPISKTRAKALVRDVTQKISEITPVLIELYVGRAWVALGYETWESMCLGEFGGRVVLPKSERPQVVQELSDAGLSQRAIASATGVSKDTVGRDLAKSGVSNETPEGADAKVIGLDGKRQSKTKQKPVITEPQPVIVEQTHEPDEAAANAYAALLAWCTYHHANPDIEIPQGEIEMFVTTVNKCRRPAGVNGVHAI